MAAMAKPQPTSLSLKDYLKRYESKSDDARKNKKKKKSRTISSGVLVVDADPVWQKPVNLEDGNESDSGDEAKPQADVDIEVKRMKRLEEIRSKKPYLALADDGSGWISVSDASQHLNNDEKPDFLLQQQSCSRPKMPEPASLTHEIPDLSPPRRMQAHTEGLSSDIEQADLSPPRRHKRRNEMLLPAGDHVKHSPQHRQRKRLDTPSDPDDNDMSSSYRGRKWRRSHVSDYSSHDLSPASRPQKRFNTSTVDHDSSELNVVMDDTDLSLPRRHHSSSDNFPRHQEQRKVDKMFAVERKPLMSVSPSQEFSPSRRSQPQASSPALYPPSQNPGHVASAVHISPATGMRKEHSSVNERKSGLFSAQQLKEEIDKQKEEEKLRFSAMDPAVSGKGAQPVYRYQGKRVSKEEYMKLLQGEEKPKEKKLEWGKGLAQKREAEAEERELELEKEKPFARTRDDPELDKMLRERVRWGDPMAHLIKKKNPELVLADLGDNEKMRESGFIIPQSIPSHSWLKRGIDPPPNRYEIRPGRHWDGVDRSNGYENSLFRRQNEKLSSEKEAYLWSVSEM